jgi:hypothetical protein
MSSASSAPQPGPARPPIPTPTVTVTVTQTVEPSSSVAPHAPGTLKKKSHDPKGHG